MKKLLRWWAITFIASSVFISCEKDKVESPPVVIVPTPPTAPAINTVTITP